MNESEQAQATTPQQFHEAMQYVWSALPNKQACQIKDFVDSQAQKIAELSALFQKAGNGAVDLAMKCAEQAKELAEARAIAEKMRDRSERPGGGHAFLPWEKQ